MNLNNILKKKICSTESNEFITKFKKQHEKLAPFRIIDVIESFSVLVTSNNILPPTGDKKFFLLLKCSHFSFIEMNLMLFLLLL